MKIILSSKRHHYVARVSIFLVMVALIAGMVGCGPVQYNLTITSTAGGNVTDPGEGTFTYDEGAVVNLVAEADEGYYFVNWTGDVGTVANVEAATTTITMSDNYSITANFDGNLEIWDWYDLDAVRDNLGGNHTLMNDLDSTTAGYTELASPTANGGKGWEPIGTFKDPYDPAPAFTGVFDGQGYAISDFFINRPDEYNVGLFGVVQGGVVQNVGVVNAEVTGYQSVGGIVGFGPGGSVVNSYYNYDEVLINGENIITVGALFNEDFEEWLANGKFLDVDERLSQEYGYYLINNVSDFKQLLAFGQDSSLKFRLKNDLDLANEANFYVPYLAGEFDGNGHRISSLSFNFDFVAGVGLFGGLASGGKISEVGVENVNVTGDVGVGGLAGGSSGSVSNSYSTGNVSGNVGVGGLVGVNVGTVSNSYSTGNVTGDLGVGGLAGYNWFWGTVSNSYSTGNVSGDGLVGGLVGINEDATVSNSYSTGNVTGNNQVGGLVGVNAGTVNNCYSTGNVTGGFVGGLVGINVGTVDNSYFTGSVTGVSVGNAIFGGLVGINQAGFVSNSYYNYDEVLINGQNMITIGALFAEDFEQWMANDKFLDVNERLAQEDGYYVINNVSDFKELLAFGQDSSLKFSLQNDLDLANEANFYVPYLAGEFHGNGHRISNLNLNFFPPFPSVVGLFGYLASGGKISELAVENANITGGWVAVGGLVGGNDGTVSESYSTGSVTGNHQVGGLVGGNWRGTVSNSYSTSTVSGENWGYGGLVGLNLEGTVSNSYATGNVTGGDRVGGLVGRNDEGTVSNSFWDTETSGQATSDGGTGKTTAEMQDSATFSGAAWDIITVANPSTRNPSYIWNIVDTVTYPFLSWQS